MPIIFGGANQSIVFAFWNHSAKEKEKEHMNKIVLMRESGWWDYVGSFFTFIFCYKKKRSEKYKDQKSRCSERWNKTAEKPWDCPLPEYVLNK